MGHQEARARHAGWGVSVNTDSGTFAVCPRIVFDPPVGGVSMTLGVPLSVVFSRDEANKIVDTLEGKAR